MNLKKLFILILSIGIISCNNSDSDIELDSGNNAINALSKFHKTETVTVDLKKTSSKKGESHPVQFMTTVNEALKANGMAFELSVIEAYTSDGSGHDYYFNNVGNKQLSHDFVPFDPNRWGDDTIHYAVDGTEGVASGGVSQSETNDAIFNAMNTWNNVTCSEGLDIVAEGVIPIDIGYVQALVGEGGLFAWTDIMHSGWNTNVVMKAIGPGWENVLGVTFTFVWTGTDLDSNGKLDVAFRDIYYSNNFTWATDGVNHIDVETVVLHESGHGLSQAHFGKAFRSNGNGELHFAPRALMNAGYTGIQRTIGGSDRAGHCSNWGQWPNN